MNNLIQQLTDNEKPFGLMSAEMQEAMLTIDKVEDIEQMVCRANLKIDWVSMSIRVDKNRCSHMEGTFRLRSDYAEEPEIVECEIKPQPCYAGNLGFATPFTDQYTATLLCDASKYPDFIGFKAHGWIWGCLYRNKKDPSMVHYMIKETDLPLYDVISMDGGKVLFRKTK